MVKENEIEINGELYVLKSSIKNNVKAKSMKGMEYCIIRTCSAGVHTGYIDRKLKGKERTIFNSRRLWYWAGAFTLSQLANDGTKKPNSCKFSQELPELDLTEIIEVIPCTNKAEKSIKAVPIKEE